MKTQKQISRAFKMRMTLRENHIFPFQLTITSSRKRAIKILLTENQETSEVNEPIARRTRGKLKQGEVVANEAIDDGELGESVADKEHTSHLSVQDRM